MPAGQTCAAKSMTCLVSEGNGRVSIKIPPSEDTTSPALTSAYSALVKTHVSSATRVRVIATCYIPFLDFMARSVVKLKIIAQCGNVEQWRHRSGRIPDLGWERQRSKARSK